MKRAVRWSPLALALAFGCAQAALAVAAHGPRWSATYVAAYNPLFSGGVPYSGEMTLSFNHGIVGGTYTATSTRPDPMYGRIVNVTGTVQHGHITLDVGGMSGFLLRATLSEDGTISGTATQKGRRYSFLAKVKSSP